MWSDAVTVDLAVTDDAEADSGDQPTSPDTTAWQTDRLLELETRRDDFTVYVRPELVVEVAFDGVQRSPRYPAGLALRFARVKGYRKDKRPEDADTIDTVRAIHTGR